MSIKRIFLVAVLAWLVVFTSGCITAFSVLVFMPSKDEKVKDIERADIKKNAKVSILLRDSTTRSGKFLGYSRYSKEQYTLKYNEARRQADLSGLPAIGDQVSITSNLDNRYEFEFVGFDRSVMVLSTLDTRSETRLGYATIRDVQDTKGNIIKGERLRELASQGRLPSLSAIDLLVDETIAKIPVNQIGEVTVLGHKGSIAGPILVLALELYLFDRAMQGL